LVNSLLLILGGDIEEIPVNYVVDGVWVWVSGLHLPMSIPIHSILLLDTLGYSLLRSTLSALLCEDFDVNVLVWVLLCGDNWFRISSFSY